jgi:hypothetical protein
LLEAHHWHLHRQPTQRAVLKALPSVGLQGIILDTMAFWERRLAA